MNFSMLGPKLFVCLIIAFSMIGNIWSLLTFIKLWIDTNNFPGCNGYDTITQIPHVLGTPVEDYPIYSEVPETAFTCDGKANGGKIKKTNLKVMP